MADIIDLANDRAEEILEDALKKAKREALVPTGRCHNCDETIQPGQRFCDTDCRDDWEYRNKVQTSQFADGVVKDVAEYDQRDRDRYGIDEDE